VSTGPRTKCFGYILISILIAVSVVASVYNLDTEGKFNKPFTFTYFHYSFMSFLVLIYYIKEQVKMCFRIKKTRIIREREADIEFIRNSTTDDNFSEAYHHVKKARKMEFHEFSYQIVILLMLLCYFSKACYYFGLDYLGKLNGNGLSYSMFFFVLFEGILCFNKRCSIFKLLASIIFAAGLILIIFNQIRQSNNFCSEWIYGYLLIILSGLFYSLFAMFLYFFAKRYREEFDLILILGFIGLYTLILVPIFLLSLSIFGGEKFEFPGFEKLGIFFVDYFLIEITSEALFSYSLTYLSPKLVGVILSFSIPLTIAYRDICYRDGDDKYTNFDRYYIIGSVLLFVSALIVFYESHRGKKLNNSELRTTIKIFSTNDSSIYRRSLFRNDL